MIRFAPASWCATALLLAAAGPGRAAPSEKDQKLVKEVGDRLVAVCDPPRDLTWPPDVGIAPDPGPNAFATVVHENGRPILKDGKLQPVIRVTEGMLAKVVKGDPDRLAYILGHELGHTLKLHVLTRGPGETGFTKNVFGRNQEDEADRLGAELAVKAGYSLVKGIKAITEMQALGLEYSSFEGLGADHPSWNDRLAKLDKEKAHLWKVMAAFDNGVVFLATEQYAPAAKCFERVTAEFPACYEAWTNLGFARLMQYCDALKREDVQALGIGPVVTAGFYLRAKSVAVRDDKVKLWQAAVDALRKSNELKKGQTVVLADLGLAHLVNPAGKDAKEATRFLSEAAAAAKADPDLDPIAHAGLLINLGVAAVAGGGEEQGLASLAEGEKVVRSLADARGVPGLPPTFNAALLYTRATVLAGKADAASREKAAAMLEEYLTAASPLSLWWPVAYDKYAGVCKAVGRAAKPREVFEKVNPPPVRLTVGVKFKSGAEVSLADDPEDLAKKLGKAKETPISGAAGLRRLRFEADGIDLLVDDDHVLAIFLFGPSAPPVPLRGRTVGGGAAGEVKAGLTTKEVEALLGVDFHPCEIASAGVYYRFYRSQGLAVRVVKGKVVEVVVVQMPHR
jgi:hypothetical protein